MKTIYQTGLLLFFVISCTTVMAQNAENRSESNSPSKKSTMQVVFIDRFIVPATSKAEFLERGKANRDFIRTLPGFIENAFYEEIESNGESRFVTLAVWENEDAFKKAKEAVFAEYKRQGFDPLELFKRLNIQAERGVFKKREE
jgi:heme-degrading monooxygenase HmoA